MRLRALAWGVVGSHLLAVAMAGAVMRPGVAPVPLEERMRYLTSTVSGILWHLGWLSWALAAMTLLVFLVHLVEHVGPRVRQVVLLLYTAALAIDMLCDALQASLTGFARAGDPRMFALVERIANLGGMVAANGLYTLSIAALLPFLADPAARVFGAGVALSGAAMVVGGLVGDADIMPYVVGALVFCLCGWALAVVRAVDGAR